MAPPPSEAPAAADGADPSAHDWRGVYALSAGWALSFSVLTSSIATANLAGAAFSPSASLNTFPLALLVISLSAWSFALPRLFQAVGGRARAYRVTSAVGVAAAALAACACAARSFATLCLSSVALGLPAAAGQTFRFAVLTLVPAESRPRCVGLVLTGGVVGAVLGPGYAAGSRDLFPEAEFAGVYLCAALAYATLLAVVLAPNLVAFPAEQGDDKASKTTVNKDNTDDDAAERVLLPPECPEASSPEASSESGDPERGRSPSSAPLAKKEPPHSGLAVSIAFSRPRFVAAVFVSASSYAAMSFLMSPTPLAMRALGYSFTSVTFVIAGHMLGMYAPSFVSGAATQRLGFDRVAAAGAALLAVASGVLRAGDGLAHFAAGQAILGVGWNLCFVASTAEVGRGSTSAAEEAAKAAGRAGDAAFVAAGAQRAQSRADVATFAAAGVASVVSGAALAHAGWEDMQVVGWAAALAALVAIAVARRAEEGGNISEEGGNIAEEGRRAEEGRVASPPSSRT